MCVHMSFSSSSFCLSLPLLKINCDKRISNKNRKGENQVEGKKDYNGKGKRNRKTNDKYREETADRKAEEKMTEIDRKTGETLSCAGSGY